MRPLPDLCVSSQEFFTELVNEACEQTKFETFPQATGYLVDMMVFYMNTTNLFGEVDGNGKKSRGTLAQLLLRAANAQRNERIELLKRLGDTSLYISGFFGESLHRKLVNLDYYKEMGETAYGSLASSVNEDTVAKVYREYSRKFVHFVDILSYISSKAIRPMEDNLMQLFEHYASGSDLARDRLLEKGVVAAPQSKTKYNQ